MASPESHLLALPNEILLLIISEASEEEDSYICGHEFTDKATIWRTSAARLTEVCRRLYETITPLVYSSISLRCYAGDKYWRASFNRSMLLYRSLCENPLLRTFCSHLTINVHFDYVDQKAREKGVPINHNLHEVLFDILGWLKNTRSLTLNAFGRYGNANSYPCPVGSVSAHEYLARIFTGDYFIKRFKNTEDKSLETFKGVSDIINCAFSQMSHLHDVVFKVEDYRGLPLPQLVRDLSRLNDGVQISTLHMSHISNHGSLRDLEILRRKAGSSPVKSLEVRHFIHNPEFLGALVMWPAALESLTFEMPMGDWYAGYRPTRDYDLAVLYPILKQQKESLRHIRLQRLMTSGLHTFDVGDFRQLRSLHLSHVLTGTDTRFVRNLLAPNLHEFQWDLTFEDQQCSECLWHFDKKEEVWLRAFMQAAVDHQVPLREVHIIFQPEPYFSWPVAENIPKRSPYPWDRMEKLAREFEPHGIQLSYDEPTITKERYQEIMDREYEKYRQSDKYDPTAEVGDI